jgi:hypothetical protein
MATPFDPARWESRGLQVDAPEVVPGGLGIQMAFLVDRTKVRRCSTCGRDRICFRVLMLVGDVTVLRTPPKCGECAGLRVVGEAEPVEPPP